MMRALVGCTLLAILVASLPAACGGQEVTTTPPGSKVDAGPKLDEILSVQNQQLDKVDILFVVDNSPSMGGAQTLLSLAVPIMINRLVQPNCVDNDGMVVGVSMNGACPKGSKLEFPPVHDMHVGIITSSLGGRGSDACPDNATNPAAPSLSAHMNDNGELINRGGVQGNPTVENPMLDETPPDDFLAYFPGCTSGPDTGCAAGPNEGKTVPVNPITAGATLIDDFQTAMLGVHEHGCSFGGQNEAWYRFLVQPDPYATIAQNGSTASLRGIDENILKQRADFLRPDSLLLVAVVTNGDEAIADPMVIGGQGWAFEDSVFPGSPNGSAPEGTIECAQLDPSHPSTTGPNDPRCTSCAFIRGESDFATRCPNDPPTGTGGYLDPRHDALALRFLHQKQRFGVSAAYPVSRYITGLQKTAVPDRDHEHDATGNYLGDQAAQQNCVNPLFAANLPMSAAHDLCNLEPGPRTPDLVYYAAIAGVPHQLLQVDPTNPMSPQKDVLTDADWKAIIGNDPEHYDFSGADFHMIASTQDRTASSTDLSSPVWANHSNCPDNSADNCDPINGREHATNGGELQFSCIVPLFTVNNGTIIAFQKDCATPGPGDPYAGACDCAPGSPDAETQLCQRGGSGYTAVQVNAKAYPPVREMLIAKAMSESTSGNQGIVGSICPISLDIGQTVAQAQQDPLFGFNPAVNAIINRLKTSLGSRCLPQKLEVGTDGTVPCLVMVQMPPSVHGQCKSPGSVCNALGLIGPGQVVDGRTPLPQDILDRFCNNLEAQYTGKPGAQGDPANIPVCAMQQIILDPNDLTDCSTQQQLPGWCYVQGAAAQAKGCPSTIAFSANMPPNNTVAYLECITP
jgi:hypothetical protein